MALVEAALMLTLNIQDEKITRENGSDIVWSEKEKRQDVVSIEIGNLK